MGKQELSGQSVDDVLILFEQKKRSARQKYRAFVIDGIKHGRRDDLVGGGLRRSQGVQRSGEYEAYDERILGNGEFVESLWRGTGANEIYVPKMTLDGIIQRTAETLGIKLEFLRQRNRNKEFVDARAAICHLAVREYNYSGVAVAKALNMSRSGVSVAIRRGVEVINGNPTLRETLIDKSTTSP
jgi:hypothetical protein